MTPINQISTSVSPAEATGSITEFLAEADTADNEDTVEPISRTGQLSCTGRHTTATSAARVSVSGSSAAPFTGTSRTTAT